MWSNFTIWFRSGALITILDEDLPHLPKWKPEPPLILAKQVEPLPRTAKVESTPQRPSSLQRIRELPSPVAELLRANNARPIPADPGAAASLRGSILFAGITQTPRPTVQTPAPKETEASVKVERGFADSLAAFDFSAPAPMAAEFSLAGTVTVSDLQLVDLRRLTVELESSWASVLEAAGGMGRLAWLAPEAGQRFIRTLRTLPTTNQTPF
jgi:hypothetical protein